MNGQLRTHCLGRFLIDLPQGTRIRETYVTADARVQSFIGRARPEFERDVLARERELMGSAHRRGGNLFVDKYALSADHVVLVSWDSASGRRVYRYDEYQYFPKEQVVFRFESRGDATPQAMRRAREGQREFAQALRVRSDGDIPEVPGFCIERGFVSGNALNREEVEAAFSFPGRSQTLMSFTCFMTRNPERRLIDRIPPSGPTTSGARLVRAKRFRIGALEGDEVVLEEHQGEASVYEFFWEFPGEVSALARPFVKLGMTLQLGAIAPDADFDDVDSASRFWLETISTLRLRPGAV